MAATDENANIMVEILSTKGVYEILAKTDDNFDDITLVEVFYHSSGYMRKQL